ncbi:unnamed protein product [Leptosia nina]|uniref:Uncharacterized protein n=1 Tax=Leptosia nina TaxID=320188 RepID=A0AAV1JYD4_9NEOP
MAAGPRGCPPSCLSKIVACHFTRGRRVSVSYTLYTTQAIARETKMASLNLAWASPPQFIDYTLFASTLEGNIQSTDFKSTFVKTKDRDRELTTVQTFLQLICLYIKCL